jgi:predicted ATPase
MKIRKLTINNFRGLSHIECEFDQATNIIVGPNAIGKTTVLEAVRLAKALLAPRYFQEAQQVLVSLGAVSPHPHLAGYLDYASLARDPLAPLTVAMTMELNSGEKQYLRAARDQIGMELLRGGLARNDDEGQLALTQFLSSEQGKAQLTAILQSVDQRFGALQSPAVLPLQLTIDSAGRIGGSDPFIHSLVKILERRCPPHQALFSYFPADRAFPTGEANIQIGSGESSNQIQSHLGQAPSKYQRLKQSVINNLLLSGFDKTSVQKDFEGVLEKLLPGKQLAGLSLTPVGTLMVSIREISTGKVFDIDSMSSGEKGLILTFMLLRRSLAAGGVALLDEPELHLNPAVCRNIVPFISESVVAENDIQILLCTHSAEILSTAFDNSGCSIHHLRSHKDATKIYKQDNREVFDALRRLGTTAAESLFSRGNIFVEGDHDAMILEEGFYEQVTGYRVSGLGGRREIEKEIAVLQEGERRGELDRLNCFIFDLDRRPSEARSSELVRILQWDRYCLENYLINKKCLYDELLENKVAGLGSRGTFESRIIDLAMVQLDEIVAKEVYSGMEPDNPGIRPAEIERRSCRDIGGILAARLSRIQEALHDLDSAGWQSAFVEKCDAKRAGLVEQWQEGWVRVCNGKRLIDDLYREYAIHLNKVELKRRLIRRLKRDGAEEWTLIRTKLMDALHG